MHVVTIEGDNLSYLLSVLNAVQDQARASGEEIRTVTVAIDGGFKFKVNGGWWSPPLGQLGQD